MKFAHTFFFIKACILLSAFSGAELTPEEANWQVEFKEASRPIHSAPLGEILSHFPHGQIENNIRLTLSSLKQVFPEIVDLQNITTDLRQVRAIRSSSSAPTLTVYIDSQGRSSIISMLIDYEKGEIRHITLNFGMPPVPLSPSAALSKLTAYCQAVGFERNWVVYCNDIADGYRTGNNVILYDELNGIQTPDGVEALYNEVSNYPIEILFYRMHGTPEVPTTPILSRDEVENIAAAKIAEMLPDAGTFTVAIESLRYRGFQMPAAGSAWPERYQRLAENHLLTPVYNCIVNSVVPEGDSGNAPSYSLAMILIDALDGTVLQYTNLRGGFGGGTTIQNPQTTESKLPDFTRQVGIAGSAYVFRLSVCPQPEKFDGQRTTLRQRGRYYEAELDAKQQIIRLGQAGHYTYAKPSIWVSAPRLRSLPTPTKATQNALIESITN